MKGDKATIKIWLDEDGKVTKVLENGKPLEYEDDPVDADYETHKHLRIEGSQLHSAIPGTSTSATASSCCWKKVGGRWKCRAKFCS